jgi:hypothetical protein
VHDAPEARVRAHHARGGPLQEGVPCRTLHLSFYNKEGNSSTGKALPDYSSGRQQSAPRKTRQAAVMPSFSCLYAIWLACPASAACCGGFSALLK